VVRNPRLNKSDIKYPAPLPTNFLTHLTRMRRDTLGGIFFFLPLLYLSLYENIYWGKFAAAIIRAFVYVRLYTCTLLYYTHCTHIVCACPELYRLYAVKTRCSRRIFCAIGCIGRGLWVKDWRIRWCVLSTAKITVIVFKSIRLYANIHQSWYISHCVQCLCSCACARAADIRHG